MNPRPTDYERVFLRFETLDLLKNCDRIGGIQSNQGDKVNEDFKEEKDARKEKTKKKF